MNPFFFGEQLIEKKKGKKKQKIRSGLNKCLFTEITKTHL